MKKLITFACLCTMALSATAQWQRPFTPNDTLQPVRITADGDAVFSIYAPKARQVALMGDIVPWTNPPKGVEKNGVWSFTVNKPVEGVYRYYFIVDGVKVSDPKRTNTSGNEALAVITPTGDKFFSYRPDIAHGSIATRSYWSKTLNAPRTMRVWTPAGYEKSTEKLPVLYLIHGGGDNDSSWPTVGCAGEILDNLMAEGKIKPMVVVMPNGTIEGDLMNEVPLFEKDMVTDIIPFVEANYRVKTDKNSRAIAGLSMGGMETMETALKHPELFAYVWVLSAGYFPDRKEEFAKYADLIHKAAPGAKKNFKVLAFTQGGPTDIAYNNCKATLKEFDKAGYKYEYNDVSGGHSWEAWRQNLYDLAPRLWK